MSTAYLSYWKPRTVKQMLKVSQLTGDEDLTHSASNQYGKLRPDDSVWISTAWKGGYLILLGRIVVGEIVAQEQAERIFGTKDLWSAFYHIVAKRGTVVPIRLVDISDFAKDIRFVGKRDRLSVVDGRVNAQQLQTLRELTVESSTLLERRWLQDLGLDPLARPSPKGTGFGDAETNWRVESAAIQAVRRYYESAGWSVTSVESQRIGYDLRCTRNRMVQCVEVKGTRSSIPSFILTEGERLASSEQRDWLLCVVTGALGPSPKLVWATGAQMKSAFDLQPLVYRAVPVPGTANPGH
jgi:uncharacterized protein DUF3883